LSRIVYVNGRYVPYAQAAVHAEDRGFQFGDGIYEVCEVRGGRLIDEARHMQRLARSLGELKIAAPMSAPALGHVMREVIRRNRVKDGLVYLQVTRGAAPREFLFPADTEPTFMGDSVGRWEGDTLVVDVTGFNDKTWVDTEGHQHSDALHVIERYRRSGAETIDYQVTIDDPKTYQQSWTSSRVLTRHPEWTLKEYVCEENNKITRQP